MVTSVIDGRYHILEKIGEGSAAEVFKAMDTRLGRLVAIKVLRDTYLNDPTFIHRFENEARVAAQLAHPNIVEIYDYHAVDSQYFISMEYVPGPNLKAYLAERAPLPEEETRQLTTRILQGLAAAHEVGLVHRDMKPHNVLLSQDGRPKLTDFGIVKAMGDGGITELGTGLGTPHYVAPEQAMGDPVTPRSDLYSVGVMMYEMLSGRLPFDGDNTLQVAYSHIFEQPEPLRAVAPEVSTGMVSVVERVMAKDPEQRFGSAGEMLRALADTEAATTSEAGAATPFVVTTASKPAAAAPNRTALYDLAPARRRSGLAAAWLPLLLAGLLLGCLLLRPAITGLLNDDAPSSKPIAGPGLPVAGPTQTSVALAPATASPSAAGTESGGSYTVSATTLPPPPPGNVVSATTEEGIQVSWHDTPNETSYTVERSSDAKGWEVVATPGADQTTYTDSGVQPGESYHYRVSASNSGGSSGYSVVRAVAPSAKGPTAAAQVSSTPTPGGLGATAVSSEAIKLQWKPQAGARSYTVERSNDGESWRPVTTVAASRTAYTDAGLRAGRTYYYRVRITYEGGGAGYLSAGKGRAPVDEPTSADTTGGARTVVPARTPLPSPTDTRAPQPTGTPRAVSTNTPQPEADATEAPVATDEPEEAPTEAPEPSPIDTATPEPADPPEPEPTDTPEPEPTDTPEPEPTDVPEPDPTDAQASEPTNTPEPEVVDTLEPEPTDAPDPEPTPLPEEIPAPNSTDAPEPQPTDIPEPDPTDAPEAAPTEAPADSSDSGLEATATPQDESASQDGNGERGDGISDGAGSDSDSGAGGEDARDNSSDESEGDSSGPDDATDAVEGGSDGGRGENG